MKGRKDGREGKGSDDGRKHYRDKDEIRWEKKEKIEGKERDGRSEAMGSEHKKNTGMEAQVP